LDQTKEDNIMNTEPIKKYIQSIEAFKKGDRANAEIIFSQSIGIQKPTPYIKNNLDELLNPNEPNDVILTLLIYETKRGI
jgi:hypothetical protein